MQGSGQNVLGHIPNTTHKDKNMLLKLIKIDEKNQGNSHSFWYFLFSL